MSQNCVLANAKIILPDEVVEGSIVIRNGQIAEIAQGSAVPAGALDCDGDYLAPGLIELHTDNLERHISPRPKVDWPHRAAILAHDREMAGAGITTIFDAIRVGSILTDHGKRYGKYARQLTDEVLEMRGRGVLKISHHIHLRAEVCSETLSDELEEFGPEDRIGIVSLMDHTPGQRQFTDMDKYKAYVCGKHGLPADRFDGYCTFLYALQERLGARHEAAAVAAAHRFGATLASHDDTTAAQVEKSRAHGITLAEFPTTLEAADACTEHGMETIMGAPNLVRGASHSGNVAAIELARRDKLDILSSDYVPASLLLGAQQLAQLWDDLPRAIRTVTETPARAAQLADRGALAPGMRADLLRFSLIEDLPALREVWVEGRRVI